jgi:hypothetical protein
MPPTLDNRTFSQVIEQLASADGPRLSVAEMVDAFDERGFGALMLLFAILNALPLPPGATTVLGAPLLFLSFQLAIRRDEVWLPRWAMKAAIDRSAYRAASDRVIPSIRKVENLTRPRLSFLTGEISQTAIGVVCLLLSIVLVLPIWLGNMAPAITIGFFALGLMQRDGFAVLLGWLGVATSVALLVIASATIISLAQNAMAWLSGVF